MKRIVMTIAAAVGVSWLFVMVYLEVRAPVARRGGGSAL
jgi:hypothetical protein